MVTRTLSRKQRKAFGEALRVALAEREVRQVDLAKAIRTTQSSVSAWVTGAAEPAARTVFMIERVLDLPPGSLSRILGYLPVDVEGPSSHLSLEQFVARTSELEPRAKRVLLATYRALLLN